MVNAVQPKQTRYPVKNRILENVAPQKSLAMHRYLSDIITTLNALPTESIETVVNIIEQARNTGKRVYIFGNGGSAATASHFACDLAKGAIVSSKPRIKAFPLTDSTPLFSAWANDTDYSHVFTEQLKNYVEPDDVVIAISGSGNSANVINAVLEAKERGAVTIGFTGFKGGQLHSIVDVGVLVPNNIMEQVEDVHMILSHLITTMLRTGHISIVCATTDVGELEQAAQMFLK